MQKVQTAGRRTMQPETDCQPTAASRHVLAVSRWGEFKLVTDPIGQGHGMLSGELGETVSMGARVGNGGIEAVAVLSSSSQPGQRCRVVRTRLQWARAVSQMQERTW